MKKIMVAAAVMLAVVGAKAAAVDWDVGFDSSPATTVAEGWVAYLVNGTQYDTFSALSVAEKVAFFDNSSNYLSKEFSYEGRENFEASGNGGSWAAGTQASAFAVLFDNANASAADYIAWTAVGTDTISAGDNDGYISFGTFEDAMATAGSSAGWVATATPEPTSGLLLLIGMAGLALRRRRA